MEIRSTPVSAESPGGDRRGRRRLDAGHRRDSRRRMDPLRVPARRGGRSHGGLCHQYLDDVRDSHVARNRMNGAAFGVQDLSNYHGAISLSKAFAEDIADNFADERNFGLSGILRRTICGTGKSQYLLKCA